MWKVLILVSVVQCQFYDPWAVVNQMSVANTINAAALFINEVENQSTNNTNVAVQIVNQKSAEAQQVVLLTRSMPVVTVEQRLLLTNAAYQGSMEVESSRTSAIKNIEIIWMQSKAITQSVKNALVPIKQASVWSQQAQQIVNRYIQQYKQEMENRAKQLQEVIRVFNSNIDGSLCRIQSITSPSLKKCATLITNTLPTTGLENLSLNTGTLGTLGTANFASLGLSTGSLTLPTNGLNPTTLGLSGTSALGTGSLGKK